MEFAQVIRRPRSTAPPSLRALILLVASAFLSGTVLAGLLFVGIWRHTAADGERAQAGQAAAHRIAVAAQHRVAQLTEQVDRQQGALVAARRRAAAARAAVAALDRALPPRLASIGASTHTLATKLSALRSELAALQSYLRQPGPTGVDAGYLLTQVRYISASAAAVTSAASAAERQAEAASATVGRK